MLNLKPTPAQAVELLSNLIYLKDSKLLQACLANIPRDQINHPPRNSSEALEKLVGVSSHRNIFPSDKVSHEETENLRRLELLLDAGARWNPDLKDLRYTRRYLLDHDDRYIVQLLRLLLYTPDAANLDTLLELCRSQTLMARIGTVDAPLVQELHTLRKTRLAVSGGDASANTEKAPVAVADTPAA